MIPLLILIFLEIIGGRGNMKFYKEMIVTNGNKILSD